jgi:hypothetical protein
MSLEAKINADLKDAMKAKDQVALRGIRAIKSAILLQKTSGSGVELDEAGEIKLLQNLVKQRKDSISIFETQKREDLAVVEREEVSVIERYLPQALSAAELEALVKEVIAAVGATSKKDMGKVMAAANKKVAGKAEGAAISAVVKNLLP